MGELSGAVGLISGGLDSTIVTAYMDANYDQSHLLFCDYGQKTLARERRAFDELCAFYQPASSEVIDLTWMRRIGKSGLFEPGTTLDPTNRQREYVPFRNAVLLATAVAMAENVEADAVLIGSTAGDRICPDNSPEFLDAFQEVISIGTMTEKPIELVAPLALLDKKGVIQLGVELEAPMHLSWSCHNNSGDSACGGCSNCLARRTAFSELGMTDPLRYDDMQ